METPVRTEVYPELGCGLNPTVLEILDAQILYLKYAAQERGHQSLLARATFRNERKSEAAPRKTPDTHYRETESTKAVSAD